MSEIFEGTSSWSEKGWKGVFYPGSLPAASWLTHYATQFRAVEADVTYYRVPSKAMVKGWEEKTPDGFQLCAKFPRSIVHCGKGPRPDGTKVLLPEYVAEDAERFLEAMELMGQKAGPLALQFPYFNRQAFAAPGHFLDRLDAFLEWLPGGFRYAVELRNKAWMTPGLFDILQKHGVSLIWADLKYMPFPTDIAPLERLITTDFLYVRLIGDRDATEALTDSFDKVVLDQSDRLERWAKMLSEALGRIPRAFIFANNHFAGHAPDTIRELMKHLRPQGA